VAGDQWPVVSEEAEHPGLLTTDHWPLTTWILIRAGRQRGQMLAAGSIAPRFAALNQDGNEVRLEDFLGKKSVVLFFFPKDDTPG
jgi:hypothetical protein